MNSAQDWLTLIAIIVALFGPHVYDFFKNRSEVTSLDKTLICIIDDFIFDLQRILNERNPGAT
jgi:hypothetical protein